MASIDEIIKAIDQEIDAQNADYLSAPEANEVLTKLNLLSNRDERGGSPLRILLREGLISHAYKVDGRWRIPHSKKTRQYSITEEGRKPDNVDYNKYRKLGLILVIVFAVLFGLYYFDASEKKTIEARKYQAESSSTIITPRKTTSYVRILRKRVLYYERTGLYGAYCEVQNMSRQDAQVIPLQVIFFDKRNRVLGASHAQAMNIPSGYSKEVYFDPIDIDNAISCDIEIGKVIYEISRDEVFNVTH